MKLHLESARHEPFRWQETVTLSPAELGLGRDHELSPVGVEGTLTHVPPGYLLEARLAFQATMPCDRCLASVTFDLEPKVTLVVERRDEEEGSTEHELQEDELGIVEVEGEVLETRPLVAEQVLLHLPAKPLCRQDCAGLCPTCGADLNAGPCGCAEGEGDARWAALAAFKNKPDGGS